jgi:hypothetical protein
MQRENGWPNLLFVNAHTIACKPVGVVYANRSFGFVSRDTAFKRR